ncbi:MAG: hypothetical protein MHM6MM_007921 [Cercozoa sp. M6MM]
MVPAMLAGIVTLWLAIRCRKVPPRFNVSKTLGLAAFLSLLSTPIALVLEVAVLQHVTMETRMGTFEVDDSERWDQVRQALSWVIGLSAIVLNFLMTLIICLRVIVNALGSKGSLAGTSIISAYSSTETGSRLSSSIEPDAAAAAVSVRVKAKGPHVHAKITSKEDPAGKLKKVERMLERKSEESESTRKRVERLVERLNEVAAELRGIDNTIIALETEREYLKTLIK